MTVSVIRSWHELDVYRDEWEDLLTRSATNEPTLSPMWLKAWWDVFGNEDGRELRVALIRRRGRLIGLAPLLFRRVRHRDVIPLRRIEFLGSGEREQDEICSDYLNVIADQGKEAIIARSLADALRNKQLGWWDEVVLDVMSGDAPITEQLIHQFGRTPHLAIEVTERRPCPYATLPKQWDGYLASLPSKHRYVVRRALRELDKQNGEVEVHRAQTRDQLQRGLDILIDLHGQRWREAGSQGVFASARFLAFHQTVLPALLDAGALDLMWLTLNGEPIAAVYNILWDNKVYFYQSGRRMDLPKKLKAGIAMHAFAMQHAIREGRTKYDFLSGASQYKSQLSTGVTPLIQLRVIRERSVAARAKQLAVRGELLAKSLRERLLNRNR